MQLQPTVLETRRELFSRLTSRWEVAVSRSLNWEPALKRPRDPALVWSLAQIQKTDTNTKIQKSKDRFYLVLATANKKSSYSVLALCELKSGHKNKNRQERTLSTEQWQPLKGFQTKLQKPREFFLARAVRDDQVLQWPQGLGPTWSNLVCPGSRAVQRRGPSVSRQWEPAERNRTNTISCVEKYGLKPQQIHVNWQTWEAWACE